MRNKRCFATVCALLAALTYAVHLPFAKSLLSDIAPTFLASFLYLGAGFGVGILYLISGTRPGKKPESLSRKDLPFTVGMVLL